SRRWPLPRGLPLPDGGVAHCPGVPGGAVVVGAQGARGASRLVRAATESLVSARGREVAVRRANDGDLRRVPGCGDLSGRAATVPSGGGGRVGRHPGGGAVWLWFWGRWGSISVSCDWVAAPLPHRPTVSGCWP